MLIVKDARGAKAYLNRLYYVNRNLLERIIRDVSSCLM
jgi:hypothetical protein